MKIKVKNKSLSEVLKIKVPPHKKPKKQWWFFRFVIKIASIFELMKVKFTCNKIGMEKLKKGTPCLVLMNHSSFVDLKIAGKLLGKKPYNIVCTSDGFVGKEWLMRRVGCIPTKKFQTDLALIRDIRYALYDLKSSVLMYPEASYTFDGTATPLPDSLGKFLKYLNVPVVMIKTYGAFALSPLYNNLKIRKVKVSADMEYLLSPEQIAEKSPEEINEILSKAFDFDGFKYQQENKIKIDEPFRAEGLNRVLYKCPHCQRENEMAGEGETLKCKACGVEYRLTEYGALECTNAEPKFTHIPDWFKWQREEVKKELIAGTYKFEIPVSIGMMVDMKAIYKVGNGTLSHTSEGLHLIGCDGQIDILQKPNASYGLYSDFYWYEISDIICIGSGKALYYCFIDKNYDVVTKARLAAEELFKLNKK